jgi:hypothetical protein
MTGWPYLLVLLLPVLGMAFDRKITRAWSQILWVSYFVFILCFVGLRKKVGGDWDSYEEFIKAARNLPLIEGLQIKDPGYALLNWVSANLFNSVYLANFLSALIAVGGLFVFCSYRTNKWLSLVVSAPYLVVVVFMGYTRQSAAVGLVMIAILLLERKNILYAALFIMLAGLFHRTAALFLLPIILISAGLPQGRRIVRTASIFLFSVLYVAFLFRSNFLLNIYSYVLSPAASALARLSESEPITVSASSMHSAGALFRLTATAGAGAGFLFVAYRMRRSNLSSVIWGGVALGSLALVPVSLVASTFADRIGLYFIPMQLHFACVVSCSINNLQIRLIFEGGVAFVSAVLLVLWLHKSQYAPFWLPYDNLLQGVW